MTKLNIKTVNIKTAKPWIQLSSGWPMWMKRLERFIRVRVFNQQRYLIGDWTFETTQDMKVIHGMDVEEELANTLKEEIAKEIAENGSCTWKEFCEKYTDV